MGLTSLRIENNHRFTLWTLKAISICEASMQSRLLWLKYSSFLLAFLITFCLLTPVRARATDYPTHPLDSLSREEIAATVEVWLEGKLSALNESVTPAP